MNSVSVQLSVAKDLQSPNKNFVLVLRQKAVRAYRQSIYKLSEMKLMNSYHVGDSRTEQEDRNHPSYVIVADAILTGPVERHKVHESS